MITTLSLLPAVGNAAVDPYPNGCVSCHVLDKSKASSPTGLTLKGKHPAADDSLEDIPGSCLDCHDAGSKKAPPFARLLHLVHLVGGTNNAYVTTYKSDCMSCHKLNTQTGEWTMPSGPEK
jgi:hypothetical protein